MSTIRVPSRDQKSRDSGIQSGDLVLLRLPKGDFKSVKVEKNTCVWRSKIYSVRSKLYRNVVVGKFGSFLANELIGQPYGLTYEIVDKKLKYLPPRSLDEVGRWLSSPPFYCSWRDCYRGHWRHQRTHQRWGICTTVNCWWNTGFETVGRSCICM